MNVINLTCHDVNIEKENGEIATIPPSGMEARCKITRIPQGSFLGFTLYKTVYNDITGLPEPRNGTIYIVSGRMLSACPERDDLYQPGELIKENGIVVKCIGLTR